MLLITYAFAIDACIMSANGKVQKRVGNDWVDLKAGDVLSEGDVISTGFNSNAIIRLENSVCSIESLTRLSIEQIYNKKLSDDGKNVTKTIIYVDSGKASFKVNSTSKNLNDFKVHTPASTASVRGTEFDVYSDGEVDVSEGLVGVKEASEIDKEDLFISDGKPLTGFTQTKDVGGGLIPVFAGQKVEIGSDVSVITNPLQGQMEATRNASPIEPIISETRNEQSMTGISIEVTKE